MENLPEVIEAREVIDPKADLRNGVEAAKSLVDLVKTAGLSKRFGGEREHLYFEAWQALAKFYGCSIKTMEATPVEIDGVKGAKAHSQIIDDQSGNVVGGAEAFCLRDEKNWRDKPFFQLASMAQTRAGSKASRNKWSFVPALAGFACTPAEEMDEVHDEKHTSPPSSEAKTIHVQDVLKKMDNCSSLEELRNLWETQHRTWKASVSQSDWVKIDIRRGKLKEKFQEALNASD
jgi:hypothetical protein